MFFVRQNSLLAVLVDIYYVGDPGAKPPDFFVIDSHGLWIHLTSTHQLAFVGEKLCYEMHSRYKEQRAGPNPTLTAAYNAMSAWPNSICTLNNPWLGRVFLLLPNSMGI